MELSLLLDAASVAAGIFLIVAPKRAYNFGRRNNGGEKPTPPDHWRITSRVLGVVFVGLGAIMLYFDIIAL